MRLLDLFCGAGGAAMGYHRAGFDEIVGVDIADQPHYPFRFIKADALQPPVRLEDFDLVHASPPCHDHTPITGRNRKAKGFKGTAWMLAETVDLLSASSAAWIVENVGTAVMPTDEFVIRLCGSSFGLDVRRHRLFAMSFPTMAPACTHHLQSPRFRSLDSRNKNLASVVGVHGHLNYPGERELREQAMDIDWMTVSELSQAIPPAYTEYLGRQFLDQMARAS